MTGSRIRVRALLGAAITLVTCGLASAQSPGERGRALIEGLRKGPVLGLVEGAGGEGELSGRLESGAGRTFVLQTKTQRVTREGVELYRIRDRLRVDLGGLGTARLRVEGDLRWDLSPERLLLVSEEPRGRGLVVETRIELRREGGKWVRIVAQGQSAPVKTTLEERPSLVLTPPLGVGLRLARVAPAELGRRYSLGALDLETGLATRWRLSVDEELKLELGEEGKEPKSAAGLVLTWREGGASFVGWRPRIAAADLVRLAVRGQGSRLEVKDARLQGMRPEAKGAPEAAAAFLRAIARRDRAALEAALDVQALVGAARTRAGQAGEASAELRARFQRVLLDRLCDETWLEERGLRLGFASARAASFASEAAAGGRQRVKLSARPEWAFELRPEGQGWKITELPSLGPR